LLDAVVPGADCFRLMDVVAFTEILCWCCRWCFVLDYDDSGLALIRTGPL